MPYYDHMNGTDWVAMTLLMAFLVAVVLVAIWSIPQWRAAARDDDKIERTTARDILDKRYARGEIDTDDYEQRRRSLDRLPAR